MVLKGEIASKVRIICVRTKEGDFFTQPAQGYSEAINSWEQGERENGKAIRSFYIPGCGKLCVFYWG